MSITLNSFCCSGAEGRLLCGSAASHPSASNDRSDHSRVPASGEIAIPSGGARVDAADGSPRGSNGDHEKSAEFVRAMVPGVIATLGFVLGTCRTQVPTLVSVGPDVRSGVVACRTGRRPYLAIAHTVVRAPPKTRRTQAIESDARNSGAHPVDPTCKSGH